MESHTLKQEESSLIDKWASKNIMLLAIKGTYYKPHHTVCNNDLRLLATVHFPLVFGLQTEDRKMAEMQQTNLDIRLGNLTTNITSTHSKAMSQLEI